MTLDNMTNSVNIFVTDSVATVTLNRPRVHNAWDDALGVGLERAFTALSADKAVRCIVLTGKGPTFCSGADLATGFPQLPSGHDDLRGTLRRRFQDRKSTRLNSSHMSISYAVFCLKKKKK